MEIDLLKDKIKGVIYGQAIGDALGLGTEFMYKFQIREHYPNGLQDFSQIIQDKHRKRWQKGEWTDDTDQMLCILDSLIEHKKILIIDIAQKIYDWAMDGGRGLGNTVYNVLKHPLFLHSPHQASLQIWEASNKHNAANGGVMRTSVLGIWDFRNTQNIIKNATQVCKITHYDPRCIGSCVMICLIISELLKGELSDENILKKVMDESLNYDIRIYEYLQDKVRQDVRNLLLDEPAVIGYTLKTLSAGIWAMKYAPNYEEGILSIIQEGGDADTNASVAGAVLGAKYGFGNIPQKWIDGLLHKPKLDTKIDALLELIV